MKKKGKNCLASLYWFKNVFSRRRGKLPTIQGHNSVQFQWNLINWIGFTLEKSETLEGECFHLFLACKSPLSVPKIRTLIFTLKTIRPLIYSAKSCKFQFFRKKNSIDDEIKKRKDFGSGFEPKNIQKLFLNYFNSNQVRIPHIFLNFRWKIY